MANTRKCNSCLLLKNDFKFFNNKNKKKKITKLLTHNRSNCTQSWHFNFGKKIFFKFFCLLSTI